MRVLLVDAFSRGARGRELFEQFRSRVVDVVQSDKLHEQQDSDIEVRSFSNLDEFTYDRTRSQTVSAQNFDKLDLVLVSGDMRLLPWHPRMRPLVLLVSMCFQVNKPLFTAGCGTFALAYVCATGGVKLDVLLRTEGSRVEDLHVAIAPPSLGCEHVFLDNRTGDIYGMHSCRRSHHRRRRRHRHKDDRPTPATQTQTASRYTKQAVSRSVEEGKGASTAGGTVGEEEQNKADRHAKKRSDRRHHQREKREWIPVGNVGMHIIPEAAQHRKGGNSPRVAYSQKKFAREDHLLHFDQQLPAPHAAEQTVHILSKHVQHSLFRDLVSQHMLVYAPTSWMLDQSTSRSGKYVYSVLAEGPKHGPMVVQSGNCVGCAFHVTDRRPDSGRVLANYVFAMRQRMLHENRIDTSIAAQFVGIDSFQQQQQQEPPSPRAQSARTQGHPDTSAQETGTDADAADAGATTLSPRSERGPADFPRFYRNTFAGHNAHEPQPGLRTSRVPAHVPAAAGGSRPRKSRGKKQSRTDENMEYFMENTCAWGYSTRPVPANPPDAWSAAVRATGQAPELSQSTLATLSAADSAAVAPAANHASVDRLGGGASQTGSLGPIEPVEPPSATFARTAPHKSPRVGVVSHRQARTVGHRK